MRKLYLLGLTLLCVSCGKGWWENYAAIIWTVRNDTEQTLILKSLYFDTGMPSSNPMLPGNLEYREFEIEPNKSIMICKGMVPKGSRPWFNYYFEKSAEAFGEDVSWQILSENREVLKTWKYYDKNLPKQRFFEESEWQTGKSGVCDVFGFIITFEDIQQIEQ